MGVGVMQLLAEQARCSNTPQTFCINQARASHTALRHEQIRQSKCIQCHVTHTTRRSASLASPLGTQTTRAEARGRTHPIWRRHRTADCTDTPSRRTAQLQPKPPEQRTAQDMVSGEHTHVALYRQQMANLVARRATVPMLGGLPPPVSQLSRRKHSFTH